MNNNNNINPLISVEAEQATLGAMLTDPSCAPDVLCIAAVDDYASNRHQSIAKTISDCTASGEPVDVITIGEKLGDEGFQYCIELAQNTASSVNVRHYAKIVAEKSKMRALQQVGRTIGESATDLTDYDEALNKAQSSLMSLRMSGMVNHDPQSCNDVLKSCIADIKRRLDSNGEIDGLETGLKDIDARLQGLKDGHLIIIAGRPSMGKSAYGMQIVGHNAVNRGKRCLVFSLEMPNDELMERMIANIGKIPYGKIKDTTCFQEYNTHFNVAVNKIKASDMSLIDAGGLHINQMLNISRKWHTKKPVDLIMVDHINIADGDGQSREREIAHITGSLKALAKELRCPVIALSQLNRSVESRQDKIPIMSDLRDSGSIEQDADVIQMLYRDEYYNKENSDRVGVVDVYTRKFRAGEVGQDHLMNKLSMMTMEDYSGYVPPPEEPKKKGGFKY